MLLKLVYPDVCWWRMFTVRVSRFKLILTIVVVLPAPFCAFVVVFEFARWSEVVYNAFDVYWYLCKFVAMHFLR